MAFNINAHVILSGPKNIKAVTKRIQTQLGSVDARINLVAPKNLSKQISSFNKGLRALNKNITTLQSSATAANSHLHKLQTQFRSLNKASGAMAKSQASVQKSLSNTGKEVQHVANEIQAFGKDAALAIRRFAAFTVATGVVFGFVRAIQSATKAAIDYEREIVKIVQVTGASADKIDKLNRTISQLSVSLGVDANELAELGRIFAQTGQTIDEVGASIRAIARSSLAPSFGTMKSTAEGLIAAMAQFNIAASESEAVLSSLNAVSKKWAVEAEDMISVIRRAGGVFAASAGQMDDPKKALNELIGIFVAVRSTTRESADTIAVGLRTIFTRIQRRGTIEFLKQFNIELIDAKGNFIGLFPAFQELSRGLSDIIRKGDALTLSAITEELGGVRQVGKLIPAITQFNKALAATKVAGEAAAQGLGKDVALALQPLGKQFEVLQQRFNALIRDITQTKSFQNMAKIALSMANAFLSVAETLKPLVPLMTTFAAIKISKGLFEFGKGFMGGLSKGGGAAGAGGALGGAVTGGGGGGASGGAARSISAQQALTSAIKSHSILLSSNNTALTQLGTQVTGNTTAITTTGGKVATVSTQMIGAVGSLINALNRASLGGAGGGVKRRYKPPKFAKGGYVRGPSHAQGGVSAELEGGEYVIPKGFDVGGLADLSKKKVGVISLKQADDAQVASGKVAVGSSSKQSGSILRALINNSNLPGGIAGNKALLSSNKKDASGKRFKDLAREVAVKVAGFSTRTFQGIGVAFPSTEKSESSIEDGIKERLRKQFKATINRTSKRLSKLVGGIGRVPADENIVNQIGLEDSTGKIFEGAISALGSPFKGSSADLDPFDFPSGVGAPLGSALEGRFSELASIPTDAKKTLRKETLQSVAADKTKNLIAGLVNQDAAFQALKSKSQKPTTAVKRAAGGSIFAPQGTDTVPAMLTPGEFVVNKKSAQSFGYGNLKKINQYAKGGVAATGNVQYLAGGTETSTPRVSESGVIQKTYTGKTGVSGASLSKAFLTLEKVVEDTIQSYNEGKTSYDEMITTVDRAEKQMETVQKKQEEGGGMALASPIPEAKKGIKLRTEDVLSAARGKPNEEAAKQAAQKMEHFTTGISSAVGAVAGFSAALSGMDFSSPEAAMASLMSLTFAISQAQAAIGAFSAMAKVGTAANAAAAASEGVETVANVKSTASELVEVAANLKSAASTGFKDQMGVMTGNLKKLGGRLGKFAKKIPGGKMIGSLASRAGGLASGAMGAAGGAGGAAVGTAIGAAAAPLLAGAAAGWITNKIGGMIDAQIRGKKEEIAPGVTGIRGETEEGAAVAGIAKGAATGAAMGAFLGPVGLVVGTALGAFIGKMTEQLAQAEFNAFVEMQDNLKGANEQLGRFAKLTDISRAALANLNTAVAKPIQSFDKIQEASFEKAQGGIGLSNVLGNKGMAQRAAGFVTGTEPGGAMGLAASTGSAALAGAGIGALIGAMTPLSPVTAAAGAAVGAFIGGVIGLTTALVTTDQTVKNTALSFDRAAQSITPEFIENLNKAFDQASGTLIDKLDMSQVRDLASLETVSQDLNPSEQAALTSSSFKEMNGILNSTTGETSGFVKELQRLSSIKIQAGLIDAVRAEADLLGEDGGQELKTAFVHLRKSLDIDQLVEDGDMSKVTDAIKNSGLEEEHQKLVEGVIKTQMEGITEGIKAKSVQETLNRAAKASRKALDALVAGLQQFGEKTTGIAVQMGLVSDQMKTAMAQITGEATIGEFKKFNPFENLASATDKQIDSSISQIKEFGGSSPEGNVAFGGIGKMLKAGRDFPLAMRNIVDKIDAAETGGAKLDTQAVVDMVNEGFGGALPDILKKSLEQELESAPGRQGGGAFTSDMLRDMFETDGGVHELLGKAFKATKEEMAKFDKTVVAMKNSLMEVARIQEQMAKHRLSSELAMLDKQEAIRDRVNKALGTSVGAFGQAMDDLQKRVTIQLRGGLKPGQGVVGVPGGAGADVLDPEVLFARLKTIDDKRAETRAKIGVGKPEDMAKNNELLGKLNREMNGTVAALKTLASDTRKLAAIEAKIAGQQERGKGAQGTVDSILDGLNKYMTGEMSAQDFNKNVTQPLTTVNKVFDDTQQVTFSEGLDFAQRVKSGDPAIAGWAEFKMRERAEAEGVDISDPAALKAFSKDFYKQLTIDLAATGAAIGEQIGAPELGNVVTTLMGETFEAESEAEILGNEMREVGAQQVSIMQKMLAREEALMATVLKNADEGFNTAVNDFQAAVTEFAIMRGGVTEGEMKSLNDEVTKAQAAKDAADAEVAALVTDRVDAETGEITSVRTKAAKDKITEAGDAAAQAAAEEADTKRIMGPEGSQMAKERKSRIDTARANAEAEAERAMAQDIANKRQTAKRAGQTLESKTALRDKIKDQKELEEREKVTEERRERERKEKKDKSPATPEGPVATAADLEKLSHEELQARAEGLDLSTKKTERIMYYQPAGPGVDAQGRKKIEGDVDKSKAELAAEIEKKELQERAGTLGVATDKEKLTGFGIFAAKKDVRQDKTNEELREDIAAEENLRRGPPPPAVAVTAAAAPPAAPPVTSPVTPPTTAAAEAAAARPATPVVAEAVPEVVEPTVDAPAAGAAVRDKAARIAVAGGCCSDILTRLDQIIGLLGVGGPPSEAAAASVRSIEEFNNKVAEPVAAAAAAADEAKVASERPGTGTGTVIPEEVLKKRHEDMEEAKAFDQKFNQRQDEEQKKIDEERAAANKELEEIAQEKKEFGETGTRRLHGKSWDYDKRAEEQRTKLGSLDTQQQRLTDRRERATPMAEQYRADWEKENKEMGWDVGASADAAFVDIDDGAAAAQVAADTQPGGPTQLQQDHARYQQSRQEGRRHVQGQDLNAIAAANLARKDKQETELGVSSTAGIGPGNTEAQLKAFRQAAAASTSPGRAAGGRMGRGGRGRGGGRTRASRANTRQANINKREQRRTSRASSFEVLGFQAPPNKARDAMQGQIDKSDKKIGLMEARRDKYPEGSPRWNKINANIDREKGNRDRVQNRLNPPEAGQTAQQGRTDPTRQPQGADGTARAQHATDTAGAQTIDQVGRGEPSAGTGTGPGSRPAGPGSRPAAAGATEPGAAAGGNLEELLRGTAFAATVGEAFTKGGLDVAGQIKDAFKHVIPPKIEMTGELGVIKVHLTGGDVLQKFNKEILDNMQIEMKKTVESLVKKDALNAPGEQGPGGEGTG